MKKHKMPDMKEGNVNVTPLIDIVMCLIIFYMLVARIGVDTGKVKGMKLPDSHVGSNISDPANTINLNVVSDGKFSVWATDGKELRQFFVAPDAAAGEPGLIPFLTQWRGNNTEAKAIIRADKNTPYERIEPILLACAKAKVKEYQFEAKKEGGQE